MMMVSWLVTSDEDKVIIIMRVGRNIMILKTILDWTMKRRHVTDVSFRTKIVKTSKTWLTISRLEMDLVMAFPCGVRSRRKSSESESSCKNKSYG